MFLINLRVKLLIKKSIEDNILEGITYWFYIILLLDFVLDIQNKKNFVNRNYV